jgi:hypothetical protein
MQEKIETRNAALWGILLICGGIFFLLQNMGWFGGFGDLLWTGLFGIGGLFFVYLFLSHRAEQWWAAIPGFTLLGLAAVTFLDNFGPAFVQPLTGSVFLGSIGLGFVMVYLANPRMWWAIIPGGVMLTLAVVAGLDELHWLGIDSGGIFFLGLGLTFLVLGLLSQHSHERLTWAFIPATVLIVMGILIGTNWIVFMNTLWPLALIGVGGYWLWRSMASQNQPLPPSSPTADPSPISEKGHGE